MTTEQSLTAEGIKLLPCPFCGGEADVSPRTCDRSTPYNPADRAFPIVRCACGAEIAGENWSGVDSAINAWNRRAPLTRPALSDKPFGFYGWASNGDGTESRMFAESGSFHEQLITRDRIPLYTHPQPQQALSDERIRELAGGAAFAVPGMSLQGAEDHIAGAIRQALREQPTFAQGIEVAVKVCKDAAARARDGRNTLPTEQYGVHCALEGIAEFADELVNLIRALSPAEPGMVSGRETRKVYRRSEEHADYLRARFKDGNAELSFEWQGRRWKYQYTDFDDTGDYDVLLAAAKSE